MPSFGSDRHPQPDLPGTLGYRHVHDVHDPDPADQQRYARDTGQQDGHQVGRRTQHRTQFFLRTDVEIVVVPRLDLMVLPQDGRQFVDRLAGHLFADSRCENSLQISDRQNTFLHGSIRSQYEVVLILSHRIIAFRRQHADDFERNLPETDRLAERILTVRKQVLDHGFPDHAHFGGPPDILIGEHFAFADRIFSNLHIVLVDAVDRSRGVVGPVDDLSAAVHHRRAGADIGSLVNNGLVILHF